jgi:hypothetical protein
LRGDNAAGIGFCTGTGRANEAGKVKLGDTYAVFAAVIGLLAGGKERENAENGKKND